SILTRQRELGGVLDASTVRRKAARVAARRARARAFAVGVAGVRDRERGVDGSPARARVADRGRRRSGVDRARGGGGARRNPGRALAGAGRLGSACSASIDGDGGTVADSALFIFFGAVLFRRDRGS